ncbi:hypothetical protein RF11_11936 [Thelohanellus kitauei]|uniref:MD-2-related lipid-recognition domain-containing protein n=1 Tax=Thelohanellus kitauei TaxID=669202 RepID=A0A0C2MP49_THEKT|nr:hypothetical protein RF11_11936 [Thelohanellus kitauei]
MGIWNIHIYTFLATFVNLLKILHGQAFICAKRIDDSLFYIRSVSVSGCDKERCKYGTLRQQTYHLSFIPYTNSLNPKAILRMRSPDLNERDQVVGEQNLCKTKILPCQIISGAHYDVSLSFDVPNDAASKNIWATLTIEGSDN